MNLSGYSSILSYGGNSSLLNALSRSNKKSVANSFSSILGNYGSRYGSSRSSFGINALNNQNNYLSGKAYTSGTQLYKNYETIQNSAKELRTHAQRLSEDGNKSLFAKAEKSGSTEDIVKEVKGFVEDYNAMVNGMKDTKNTVDTIYKKQFTEMVDSYKSQLSAIGITKASNGSLKVNETQLKDANLEQLQEVFSGSTSFGSKAAVKSIYVEANAASNKSSASKYGGYGTYGSKNAYASNTASSGSTSYLSYAAQYGLLGSNFDSFY